MNNKILKSTRIIAASGVLLVLGFGAPAQAEEIICASIGGLHSAVTYHLEFTKEKTLVGLQDKLTDASTKIGTGKSCEAVFKLKDFRSKMEQLAASVGTRKAKIEVLHPLTLECIDLGSLAVIDELDPKRECGEKTKGPRNK